MLYVEVGARKQDTPPPGGMSDAGRGTEAAPLVSRQTC
jgi:hypothetical protein